MKAIIFAAGLGTRLKPLTDRCPKALVLLNGKPLLWHSIQFLKKHGINELVVNVHHFADQIIDYLDTENFDITIHISDERDELLDTGGGLLKAKNVLEGNEPFVACNVDIISSIDLKKAIAYHQQNSPIATLVVRKRETSRYFMFDNEMTLTGWKNCETGENKISKNTFEQSRPFAFSGIQIVSPEIFNYIIERGKFSITPLYIRLSEKHKIIGYFDTSDFWLDLGKPGQISVAEDYLSKQKS